MYMKYLLIFILFNFSYSEKCTEYFETNYLSTNSMYLVLYKKPNENDIKNLERSRKIYLAQLRKVINDENPNKLTFYLFLYMTYPKTGETKYLRDILINKNCKVTSGHIYTFYFSSADQSQYYYFIPLKSLQQWKEFIRMKFPELIKRRYDFYYEELSVDNLMVYLSKIRETDTSHSDLKYDSKTYFPSEGILPIDKSKILSQYPQENFLLQIFNNDFKKHEIEDLVEEFVEREKYSLIRGEEEKTFGTGEYAEYNKSPHESSDEQTLGATEDEDVHTDPSTKEPMNIESGGQETVNDKNPT